MWMLHGGIDDNYKITVKRSMGDDQQVSISRRTLNGIDETTKHVS